MPGMKKKQPREQKREKKDLPRTDRKPGKAAHGRARPDHHTKSSVIQKTKMHDERRVSSLRKHEEPINQPEKKDAERIAKVLARVGVASRREAERMIAQGRISVDGVILQSPAFNVTARSTILVDGKPLPHREPPRLWRYYKPEGLITTARDPQGRPTVFAHLPKDLPRVISVGRLDIASEGLLLLTNDGALARHLELPATGWLRRYRVRIHTGKTPPTEETFARLKKGVTVEGVTYGPIEVTIEHGKGSNTWLAVGLREGKNREIRRVMKHLGFEVNRLIRVAFGPFQLGRLEKGAVEEIPSRALQEHLKGWKDE